MIFSCSRENNSRKKQKSGLTYRGDLEEGVPAAGASPASALPLVMCPSVMAAANNADASASRGERAMTIFSVNRTDVADGHDSCGGDDELDRHCDDVNDACQHLRWRAESDNVIMTRRRASASVSRRHRHLSPITRMVLPLLPLLLIALALTAFHHEMSLLPLANAEETIDAYIPINANDGLANLSEGQRLVALGRYSDASSYLWRAVILHTTGDNSNFYKADEAFAPFLKCYLLLNKVVDGLVFVAAEGYLRGQDGMGDLYLRQALDRDGTHLGAIELQSVIEEYKKGNDNDVKQRQKYSERNRRLTKIRDNVDAANTKNQKDLGDKISARESISFNFNQALQDKTPEEIYNIGTIHFNSKNLPYASKLFELSCQKSNHKLSVACTNAVYLRTNLCDWGYRGEQFEKDMKIIVEVTKAEAGMYRVVEKEADDRVRRLSGMGYGGSRISGDGEGVIHWKRSTSVHPHMMLGYPLSNENAILKRYSAEGLASLDELRARIREDTGTIKDLPKDLPYSVEDMRDHFVKKHEKYIQQIKDGTTKSTPPIKIGFVACSFNSKAVLYLSHDMFRFFDPSEVEVHIFSTGPPDHPNFIQNTMRGVDWRQRVVDAVDYFHDVQEYKDNHIGLARYIHDKEIQILIEWDGYARQGERAEGLMALRPAPIQILHQEFLMTSGAQYFDYIVTDKVVSPLRLEKLYTEKFLYLPNHFFSKGHAVQKEVMPPRLEYVPREKGAEFKLGVGSPQQNACLSSNPLGVNKKDNDLEQEVSFVYCNFNKFLKNNPETMRSWIRVLEEVPNSILCLLENPKEGVANLRKFVNEEVAAGDRVDDAEDDNNNSMSESNLINRIHFIPWEMNPFDHQQRSHSLCNVMLDSHPYNGHTTAQDALYAGVPIVTRSDGDDMSSRVTTSANVVLGLEELNAYSGVKEYEDIAIRLGTDKAWFKSIRERLVDTCLQKDPMHPYWDVPRYVKNFQSGIQIIWDRFIAGEAIDHVDMSEVRVGKPIRGTTHDGLVEREKRREEHVKRIRLNDEL